MVIITATLIIMAMIQVKGAHSQLAIPLCEVRSSNFNLVSASSMARNSCACAFAMMGGPGCKDLSGEGTPRALWPSRAWERAKAIGGNLEFWSNVESGTEIELTIPANTAYAAPAQRRSWFTRKEIRSTSPGNLAPSTHIGSFRKELAAAQMRKVKNGHD